MTGVKGRRPGYALVLVLSLTAMVGLIATLLLGAYMRDVRRTSGDTAMLTARLTAISGIELAQWALLQSAGPGEKLVETPVQREFAYPADAFPSSNGRQASCRVTAWVHPDRVYLAAVAHVRDKTGRDGQPAEVRTRKARRLIKRSPDGQGFEVAWDLSD